jgi:hypothetical protein
MGRLLVMSERTIADTQRTSYLEALAVRRALAAAASVNFWIFEQQGMRGRFLEFLEAGREASLHAAILAFASVDVHYLSALTRWVEVAPPGS